MGKKIKMFVTFSLVSILLLGSTINSFAATPQFTYEGKDYLFDGYTEDGIHYYVFGSTDETVTNIAGQVSPRIVHSEYITNYHIIYEGRIIPPSTYNYTSTDSKYYIPATVTLSLQNYLYNDYPTWPECTHAYYSGWITGNI